MADGCEANLTTDSDNCGSCGHWCCGGTCSTGSCQPANLDLYTWDFDVDDQNIYYATRGTNEVRSRPLKGGAETIIATNQANTQTVATDGVNVYWGNVSAMDSMGYFPGAGLFFAPVTGGTITAVPDLDRQPVGYILVDATNVYASTDPTWPTGFRYYDLITHRSAWLGLPIITVPLVSDGTYLYFIDASSNSSRKALNRMPMHGGASTPFQQSTGLYFGLAGDQTNLYYIFGGTSSADNWADAGVYKMPFSTGTATRILTATEGTGTSTRSNAVGNRITTDGTSVYYLSYVSVFGVATYDVRKVSVNGGTPVVVTGANVEINSAGTLRVNGSCVFWNYGDCIYTVTKTP